MRFLRNAAVAAVVVCAAACSSSGDGDAGDDPPETTPATTEDSSDQTDPSDAAAETDNSSDDGPAGTTTPTTETVPEPLEPVEAALGHTAFSIDVTSTGSLLLTGFSDVTFYDPTQRVAPGTNPRRVDLPTADDVAALGCVDRPENGTVNVSPGDSCLPELLGFDQVNNCYWVLLPNTLDCYPDPEFPDEPTTGGAGGGTTSAPPTTSDSRGSTTTESPPTTSGSGGSTTTTEPKPPGPVPKIRVVPCPPSAGGLFDGRNEKSTGTFEATCDPQGPEFVPGGEVDGVAVPFLRKGGGELGYVTADPAGGHTYVKCFQRDDYDVQFVDVSVDGDRITIVARGAEAAALGRTHTVTLTWPGCASLGDSPPVAGTWEPPPGPQLWFEGASYAIEADGENADEVELGIGSTYRLLDGEGHVAQEFVFPQPVVLNQFSAFVRRGDDLFIYAAGVNRPPGAEPGPDYEQGAIYLFRGSERGVEIELDVAIGRISAMVAVDDLVWAVQLEPPKVIPIRLGG